VIKAMHLRVDDVKAEKMAAVVKDHIIHPQALRSVNKIDDGFAKLSPFGAGRHSRSFDFEIDILRKSLNKTITFGQAGAAGKDARHVLRGYRGDKAQQLNGVPVLFNKGGGDAKLYRDLYDFLRVRRLSQR